MVVIMKPGASQREIEKLIAQFQLQGLQVGVTKGVDCSILGLVGDTTSLDMDKIAINDSVERVMRVSEPYKRANRKFHPEDTVVKVGAAAIGGGSFSVIAGPCSVESEKQIISVAEDVRSSGAALLRGGGDTQRPMGQAFAGRRLQAPHVALLLPGHGGPRAGSAAGGQGRHGDAHRH